MRNFFEIFPTATDKSALCCPHSLAVPHTVTYALGSFFHWQDLFPGLEVPSNDYGEFSVALEEQLDKHGLQKVTGVNK